MKIFEEAIIRLVLSNIHQIFMDHLPCARLQLRAGDTAMKEAELSRHGVYHPAEPLHSGSQYEEGIGGRPVRDIA